MSDFKQDRTALLDGDIIAYQTAAWAQSRGIDGADMIDRLREQVADWTRRAFCSKRIVCISCDRKDNFRRDHFPDYKTQRDDHVDPPGRASCVATLLDEFPSMTRPRIEADDLLGILGSRETLPDGSMPVMVTIDKDLLQVPGVHFNPDKDDFPVAISPRTADLAFHLQWMTGDSTDGVPGLYKVGPVKALKALKDVPPEGWTQAVLAAYRSHPKQYKPAYAWAMARCIRILRDGEWDKAKQKPILWAPKSV